MHDDHQPDDVLLGGTDHLLLALDRRARARGEDGLVCHLSLTLAGPIAPEVVAAHLASRPIWRWFTGLRLRGAPPLRRLRWTRTQASPPAVGTFRCDDEGALPDAIGGLEDPAVGPIARVSVGEVAGQSTLVFTWHHAALDARGAEAWLHTLLGEGALGVMEAPAPVSALRSLCEARRGRDFLFRESIGRVQFFGGGGPTRRLRRVLSEDERSQTSASAARAGAGLFRSAWHLAATARAASVGGRDVLVPVPQDPRRGQLPAPIGNAIRMLILRLPASQLGTGRAATSMVLDRMKVAIRDQLPAAVDALLRWCRWLPGPVLLAVSLLPTWGRMATLGFSDAGDELSRFREAWGVPVLRARHYPANIAPPGVTVVFSACHGVQAIDLLWQAGRISDDEANALLERVVAQLVCDPERA